MSNMPVREWIVEFGSPQYPDTEPLTVRLEGELVLGRYDRHQVDQPDVNLDTFEAGRHGVSRRHLLLHAENDQLLITDLQSGNGTLLNNKRLESGTPYRIKHEDRLQMGNLKLDVSIVIAPTDSGNYQDQPSVQSATKVTAGAGQLVLIIEDHLEVANLLSLIMERAGFTTQICSDVLSGIRVFNQKRPSAVLLDLMLPDMFGLEFCRYVRRDIHHNKTPIVIVSAAKTNENVADAMEAGANVFLGKPVSAKELSTTVTSLVKQYESGISSLQTKNLVGTAPLKSVPPESRRDTAVLFVAGYSDTPLTVSVAQPVSMGRGIDNSDGNHINLDRFGALDLGVSRLHVHLFQEYGKFFIEDNQSTNGTYINGNPLESHKRTQLHNSDEVRLGQLRMYIYFLTDSDFLNNRTPGENNEE